MLLLQPARTREIVKFVTLAVCLPIYKTYIDTHAGHEFLVSFPRFEHFLIFFMPDDANGLYYSAPV